jgi:chorismate mutase/prephenate dehydratase
MRDGDMGRETNIMGLDALRERLDILDAQIVALLSERAKIIMQVADFKRHHDIPVYIPEREAALLQRLQTINPGPLPAEAVTQIYRTVLEEMRKFESDSLAHESNAL